MSTLSKRVLFWSPRILALFFAAFLAVFALDVFDAQLGPWQTAQALAIHLLPSFLVLAALAFAWEWERLGAVLFLTLGLVYVTMTWGRFPLSVYLVIGGPLFLLSGLFLTCWKCRRELRPH